MEKLPLKLASTSNDIRVNRYKSPAHLKEAIDNGFVLMMFAGTGSDTELGVRLDQSKTKLSEANFTLGTGRVEITGRLVLDYHEIEVHAYINVNTLNGTASVRIVADEATRQAQTTA